MLKIFAASRIARTTCPLAHEGAITAIKKKPPMLSIDSNLDILRERDQSTRIAVNNVAINYVDGQEEECQRSFRVLLMPKIDSPKASNVRD